MANIFSFLFRNRDSVDQATLHKTINQNKTSLSSNIVNRAIQPTDLDEDQIILFGQRPLEFNKAPEDCRSAIIDIVYKNREAQGITTGPNGIYSFTDEEIRAASEQLQREYPDRTTSI